MITNYLLAISLFLLGIIVNPQDDKKEQPELETTTQSDYSILSTLHTLSIHIKDPVVHDSLFHFLKDQLQLPVYYNPVNHGERTYAGIFAGNLVLEPCGPYSNFAYATNDFKAMFFGLTFEPKNSIAFAAKCLQEKLIEHEVASDEFIYLTDAGLCGENITISIMDKHEKIKDHAKQDSLRSVISLNSNSGLGIEFVKEIQIGYPNALHLQNWKNFIHPSHVNTDGIWKTENGLNIRFLPGSLKEVKGIVFKVKSLDKAIKYLAINNLKFKKTKQELTLEPAQAFGLSIGFSEMN